MSSSVLLLLYFNEPLGKLQLGVKAKLFTFLEDLLSGIGDLKLNVYFSGFVLEWIEQERSDLFARFLKYVDDGRLEFLAGGFYEPNHALISPERSADQLNLSLEFYQHKMNVRPSCFFIPRMLWCEKLVPVLINAGMRNVALIDSGWAETGPFVGAGSELNLIGFDLNRSRKLFLDGFDIRPLDREAGGPHCIALPAELFTNKIGGEWFSRLIEVLSRSGIRTGRISDVASELPGTPVSVPELPAAELLWKDITYNYPYYFFFLDSTDESRIVPYAGSFSDYLADFVELRRMYEQQLEMQELYSTCRLDDRARKLAASLEFYGYLWPGCFGGLNYSALRQIFFRESITIQSFLHESHLEITAGTTRFSPDLIRMSSDMFRIDIDHADGGAVRLDYRPMKCNLVNCRRNYRETLDWREKIYGKVDPESHGLMDRVNFSTIPSLLCCQIFSAEEGNLGEAFVLAGTSHEEDAGKDLCRSSFEWIFELGILELHVKREISLRSTNNFIFVNFTVANPTKVVIKCQFRTECCFGLSYPGFSKNIIRVTGDGSAKEFGFENEFSESSVSELQIFDGLIGVEMGLQFENKAECSVKPDYLVDRLPEQFQLLFQGIRLCSSWPLELEPGKEGRISLCLRVRDYA
ncbi:MAG: hypothetical protein PHQ23_16725 [Candidatus Wallbacteria bacterium]|nr:hypothetical protein [Candidatus Wallbacteria bacterium]